MSDSLAEYLRQDMECEGLLECLYGLKSLDRDCYQVLIETEEPLTVDAIAERVDRERSTVYRAVQRLLKAGVVRKDQVNYDQGGYYHVYYPADPAEVTDRMQRMLNDWYAQMGTLIQEFEDRYDDRVDQPAPTN